MHRSSRRPRYGVAVDGRGLTSRSGTAALRELADGIGLTDALSAAAAPVCGAGLVHDPDAVLRDLVVMLADGGDDFSAIETLRSQTGLDGPVASDSTAWRRWPTSPATSCRSPGSTPPAGGSAQACGWVAARRPPSRTVRSCCVDIDATLVTAHSDKQDAAGTYQGGYRFPPLLAYLDRDDGTGEALAGQLRPGNAGANTASDHIDVFETALDQLAGVDPAQVLVRADSAGATQAFLGYLGQAGVEFSVGGSTSRSAPRSASPNPAPTAGCRRFVKTGGA